jgi:asparagine synthase (glutamine-hydrolysing)
LDACFRTVVKQHLLSDVPLGAFLSGGIDSSLVVATMRTVGAGRIQTFTAAFSDRQYDEAPFARDVARVLETEHHELPISPAMVLDVVSHVKTAYDEPFADSSQLPTLLLSRLTRQHVTVCLSGDGGDELFGGYAWHQEIPVRWRRLKRLPRGARSAAAALLRAIPPAVWTTVPPRLLRLSPASSAAPPAVRACRGAEILGLRDCAEFYRWWVSHWRSPTELVLGAVEPPTLLTARETWPTLGTEEEMLMFLDAAMYLPDDILAKVDRASMAYSLEVRVPLLDHRMIETAAAVPLALKIREGRGKCVLRNWFARYLPASWAERPKHGFSVPLATWLRSDLRDWANDLLNEASLRQAGILDARLVRRRWMEHCSGTHDWAASLWNVLCFQMWKAG